MSRDVLSWLIRVNDGLVRERLEMPLGGHLFRHLLE